MVRLAHSLVELCAKGHVTNGEVEEIVGLWQSLPDEDKGPVQYPVLGGSSGPATWPDASRLVEAIFLRLCVLYPGNKRVMGVLLTRWTLVLREYNSIRNVVTMHPALKTRTTIQLYVVNQYTLSQW